MSKGVDPGEFEAFAERVLDGVPQTVGKLNQQAARLTQALEADRAAFEAAWAKRQETRWTAIGETGQVAPEGLGDAFKDDAWWAWREATRLANVKIAAVPRCNVDPDGEEFPDPEGFYVRYDYIAGMSSK